MAAATIIYHLPLCWHVNFNLTSILIIFILRRERARKRKTLIHCSCSVNHEEKNNNNNYSSSNCNCINKKTSHNNQHILWVSFLVCVLITYFVLGRKTVVPFGADIFGLFWDEERARGEEKEKSCHNLCLISMPSMTSTERTSKSFFLLLNQLSSHSLFLFSLFLLCLWCLTHPLSDVTFFFFLSTPAATFFSLSLSFLNLHPAGLLVSPTLFPRPCYYYYYSSLNQVTTSMLQLMMGILLCLLFVLPLMNIGTILHVKGEPLPLPVPKSKVTTTTSTTGSNFNSRIVTVSPGEVIHLPCTLIHSGEGIVQWMKNGQPILLVSDCLLLFFSFLYFFVFFFLLLILTLLFTKCITWCAS